MIITTVLAYVVSREVVGWSRLTAGLVTLGFIAADLAFLIANYFKILQGGWFPLLVAAIVFTLMTTWRRGREILTSKLREGALSTELFIDSLRSRPPLRVPGTAVFMHRNEAVIPSSLLHSLKHYKALHERVILLTIVTDDVSHLNDEERLRMTELGQGVFRVIGRYGYMEDIDIPRLLDRAADQYLLKVPAMDTTYFLGRETLIVTKRPSGMAFWREKLFASMTKNAESAARFFRLPANRVVELGAQVEF
jgi:KUP system potassium uptake protein